MPAFLDLVLSPTGNGWLDLMAVDMGLQWLGWVAAAALRTEKFYDFTGSVTFVLLSYLSHQRSRQTLRQFVQSHMVMAWAGRLGLFLLTRVIKDGGDKRFDTTRDRPGKFFVYWTIQGVWIFVTLLPTLLLNSESSRDPPLGARDVVGWGLWSAGMVVEIVADWQKSAFKAIPSNKGKFIRSGLWSISRHPNYFGEITLWFGMYISASSVFKGWQYLSVLSPIFVHLLITRLSGVPLLEKSGLKKWGKDPEYQRYLATVPVLIPFTNWF